MRFSLACSAHDNAEVSDETEDISIDAMGGSEFEIDVSEVHCTVWDNLSSEEQEDEENDCSIVITSVAETVTADSTVTVETETETPAS